MTNEEFEWRMRIAEDFPQHHKTVEVVRKSQMVIDGAPNCAQLVLNTVTKFKVPRWKGSRDGRKIIMLRRRTT